MNLRRKSGILAAAAGLATLALVILPSGEASAHGYINSPPSRQAQCAQHIVSCGDITYEPQSVEGPKGLRSCSAGNARFAELDDDNKGWRLTSVGNTVTFTWTFTARHATRDYEYFLGGQRIALIDGGGQQPPSTVSHTISLGNVSGKQKLLAIWNIADTVNAFYACVDLNVGGTTPPPTTTTTTPPTTTTTTTKPPTTTTTPPASGSWQPWTAYAAGSQVTYNGIAYRCLQAHTSQPGWEPPNTPALWQQA